MARRNFKHGKTETPEYIIWAGMKARCTNAKHRAYPDYGGRGIKVCDEWLSSFETFLADMGRRPSRKYSIDRADNDGRYEPSNCRWVLRKEQDQHRRDNRLVTHNGRTMTVREWADDSGMRFHTLLRRLNLGWTPERAITTPVSSRTSTT